MRNPDGIKLKDVTILLLFFVCIYTFFNKFKIFHTAAVNKYHKIFIGHVHETLCRNINCGNTGNTPGGDMFDIRYLYRTSTQGLTVSHKCDRI